MNILELLSNPFVEVIALGAASGLMWYARRRAKRLPIKLPDIGAWFDRICEFDRPHPAWQPPTRQAQEETQPWRSAPAQETTRVSLQSAAQAVRPVSGDVLSIEEWRTALDENPHLLIYGPSKAGKSTLAQAATSMLGDCDYLVIDPQPNKPGERKWNGIDFVSLDGGDGDEFASIKAALKRIKDEDSRRRRNLGTETFRPLIVIIDEMLALVGELGMVRNEVDKDEARMSQFIRTMGYSARHRNIKVILIGQGKNLSDLGLTSGTARNNYALVRAARNQVTNEHSAYIVTDEGERALDVRQVVELAQGLSNRARLWLTHAQAGRQVPRTMEVDPLDEQELLSLERPGRQADRQAGSPELAVKAPESRCLPAWNGLDGEALKAAAIRTLLDAGATQTQIKALLRGDTTMTSKLIREVAGGGDDTDLASTA